MDFFAKIAWMIPLLPLAAFLVLMTLGRGFRRAGVWIGSIGALGAFLLSLLVLSERLKPHAVDYSYHFNWISIGEYTLRIGFEITNLTALMLVVVTLVGLLVNVYSAGYMASDERVTVFYGYVSLFTFSMLGLVLSDNLLSFYLFWELVGVCSFLLVGFWYARPAARAAAKKAFIVTRIGDAGLLIAILLLFWYMPDHALDFTMIQSIFGGQGGIMTDGITTLMALLLFLGAVGKSGQFPLHVWLPDAMEGPTPISALIHAATMVAAGVFLIARTFSIFEASPAAMETVAYVGAFTAIFAAAIALAQNDLKRILAYSTISQLGYMMLALGLGAMTGAIFHLFTHAFFKALLFLAAGSVIHAVHTQDIREMGGIGSRMRVTAWTFAMGALALAGIPPLSGFWSKDAILTAALEHNPVLFAVGLATAFFTALYMTRLFVHVFMGKLGMKTKEAKESPLVMTIPLIVLAVLAVIAGFVELPWNGWLSGWLSDEVIEPHSSMVVMILSIAAGLFGILAGWLLYGKGMAGNHPLGSRMPRLVRLAERKFYIDELYEAVIVKSLRGLSACLAAIDTYVIGGAVKLAGAAASAAGKLGLRLQNGQVQTYGVAAVLGVVAIALVVIGRRMLS
ncbi:NADH-quinone oxidoreductase subunit L [Paenibacillus sp. 1011MAR3C5]|uniref:NADH-quinone oxidoreductase subunit L n=1 Tax=Paenibacillus sp. 1011MAR3C5 TaxID=1675787 RepID=UPI000E6C9BC5|nr:NADH-quinone oxidoreductase subunit L [Paenibacillus sp. 1011MAR3C5]RJE85599.1 NADH-quinone oxidoreductase subunit L [Paenibacillus sp. 1011MAR3C5]